MKKIVLFSDGTGNGAGKRNKTNVWRLYDALVLEEKDQIAMYSDGVGSREFLPFKILGGAFGWGLKRNVIELYKFLCRNYESNSTKEESDKIYLFGFSRGAYTVRALAGLIAECGLFTDAVSERDLHEKALHNYSVYRNRFRQRRGWHFNLLSRRPCRKKPHFTNEPEIEFIGVWDTVDAYGLPVDELMTLWDKFIFPMRFPDRRLDKKVLGACHAISVDDERHTFHPVLWDESKQCDRDRIEQVWFPGVHADVGGGYPRHELSLVSLDWMISKVEAKFRNSSGLHFITAKRNEYSQRSDRHGIQHDSRAGFATYYRYKPRNIKHLCNDPDAGNTGVRIDVPKIHSSVFERIRDGIVPYAPTGLPETYETVSNWGAVPDFEDDHEKTLRCEAMNGALDIIFWRRWLHGIFVTLHILLIFSVCLINLKICPSCTVVSRFLDPILEIVKSTLPISVSKIIAAFQLNSELILLFAIFYYLLVKLKKFASEATSSRATSAWSKLKGRELPQRQRTCSKTTKYRNFWSGKIRSRFRIFAWCIFGLLVIAILLVLVDRVVFHVRDSVGSLCQPTITSISDSSTNSPSGQAVIEFETLNSCQPSGVTLKSGKGYLIKVNEYSNWADGEHKATPNGLENCRSLLMCLATPVRRHISLPWFKLMGRVGKSGQEFFQIGVETCYTAKSDGELFLYVNDAVFGIPRLVNWDLPYYWNHGKNYGSATIEVIPVNQCCSCNYVVNEQQLSNVNFQ